MILKINQSEASFGVRQVEAEEKELKVSQTPQHPLDFGWILERELNGNIMFKQDYMKEEEGKIVWVDDKRSNTMIKGWRISVSFHKTDDEGVCVCVKRLSIFTFDPSMKLCNIVCIHSCFLRTPSIPILPFHLKENEELIDGSRRLRAFLFPLIRSEEKSWEESEIIIFQEADRT